MCLVHSAPWVLAWLLLLMWRRALAEGTQSLPHGRRVSSSALGEDAAVGASLRVEGQLPGTRASCFLCGCPGFSSYRPLAGCAQIPVRKGRFH